MKLLWSKDLQMSTVHVSDAARAAWHVAITPSVESGTVYNLADSAMSSKSVRAGLQLAYLIVLTMYCASSSRPRH